MQISSAIELVNALVYFPGWKLSAEDHSKRFEETILVTVEYPAVNTNRENARNGYAEEISTYAKFPLVVAGIDDMGLYYKIMLALDKLYLHEAREALRVLPTYWAPFHPHNVDGMHRWADAQRNTDTLSDDMLLSDLQFGIG